jgi:hypothetical protein
MHRAIRFALVVAISSIAISVAQAQMRGGGIPPSVTSVSPGRFGAPGIPASVTSVGPRGFGGSNVFVGGVPFGHVGSGHVIINPRIDGRFVDGRFGHFRGFHSGFGVPVIVPVWGGWGWGGYGYPYGFYGMDDPPQSGQVMSNSSRYEQPMYQQPDDARYGNHYLDNREDGRGTRSQDSDGGDAESTKVIRPQVTEVAPAAQQPAKAEPDVNVVLVYKDGHRREVHNYVITGETIWDLTDHLTRKIPLSDIDLDATTKVNDERGTPITLPKS